MKYQLLKKASEISAFFERVFQSHVSGCDTETTDLNPFNGELRLIQIALSDDDIGIIDLRDFREPKFNPALEPLRRYLADPKYIKIFHNAKFDLKFFKEHLGVEVEGVFCTLLASQIIGAGDRQLRHNLAAVSERFLAADVDKTEQKSNWSGELSEAQLEYASRDAAVMLPLREKQIEFLKSEGLVKTAKLEFDAVLPVAMMEHAGFNLDRERWLSQLETVKTRQRTAADELQELLSPGVGQMGLFGRIEINLDSNQQVLKALNKMKISVESLDKNKLEPLFNQYPILEKIVKYSAGQTLSSAYGLTMLDCIHPKTGRVHSEFRQIGAPTGRFSSNNPNLQKIPNDPVYRKCFTAPAGKKLIIADFSQVELRILAHITKDENFINGFNSGRDFHTETGAMVFNCKYEELTSEQRTFSKRVNFGIAYGISKYRLSAMCKISVDEADTIIKRYLSTFRSLDRWLSVHGAEVIETRQARTLGGRLARYFFNTDDFGSVMAAKREGNNMSIQGSSADITKRAMRLIFNEFKQTSAKIVNVVHDEIIVEVSEAESKWAAGVVEAKMAEAGGEYVDSVKITADAKINNEWEK